MTATTIEVKGDSSDAQRAFNDLGKDIDRTSRKLREMAREAASVGFGVLGAGTIEEALTAAYDAARDALEGYVERNREAAEVVEGTRHALQEMTDTFYESALGGGNLEVILGSVQIIAQELTGSFMNNRDAIRLSVREGWINLLEVVPTVIGAFNGFRAVIDGVRIGFVQFRMGIRVGITALLDMGRAIQQGLLTVLQDLSQGAANVIESMAGLARSVDAYLGSNLARPFEQASARVGEFASGLDGSIERLEEIGRINRAQIQTEVVEAAEATASIVRGIEDRENARQNLAQTIAEYADRIRSGEAAEMALRRSVGEGTASIEEQAASLGDLVTALRGYATEWLQFHEIYKAGQLEKAEAEREYLDFVMGRYEAQQAKVVELAEARAAAEEGALLKLQDAADRGLAVYEDYFSGISDGLAQAIVDNAGYVEAVRAGVGDVISALAEEAAVRASLAFAGGNVASGVAYVAAAAAAKVAAAALGASRGTSSAGAGGGAAAGPTQITNVTVNAGVVADRAGLTREIADFVNEGNRQGLIA